MDLLTYLRRFEPEELVHIGGDTYATRTHDSLKISNGKWCWWSRNIGGTTALDYLTCVEGLSFLDAVQRILGEPLHVPPKSEPIAPLPKTEFTLPPKHADNRRVFSYLRSRGVDAEIINHCIKHGQLYEDAERHNCVFVGYENGKPAYGALRGTLSETTFAGEVPGSDKRFSFAVPLCAGGKTLCVFEAAIDALSYLTLLKLRGQDWRAANTLSLSGIYQPRKDGTIRFPTALEQYLKDNPGVARIVLCLDILCFDIQDLGENLKSVGLLVMLDAIYNRVIQNRREGKYTHVYIDEIYLFFANGSGSGHSITNYSSEFLYKCWKRFRKYGATLTGITQNVEECLLSNTARMMFANSEFLLMLNQATTDREQLARLLGASDTQMSYVDNAPAGHGLIKVGGAIVPFANELPKNTELYRLMSTRPGEE